MAFDDSPSLSPTYPVEWLDKTKSKVTWESSSVVEDTPDVSSILNETLARTNWAFGNSITFLITSTLSDRTFHPESIALLTSKFSSPPTAASSTPPPSSVPSNTGETISETLEIANPADDADGYHTTDFAIGSFDLSHDTLSVYDDDNLIVFFLLRLLESTHTMHI